MQKPSQSFLIRFAFQPTTKSPSVSPTPAVRYSVRNKSSTTHFLITLAFYFLSAANAESLEGRRNKVANHKPYRCTCPRPSCFSFWLPCETHHLFQAPSLAPTTDSVSLPFCMVTVPLSVSNFVYAAKYLPHQAADWQSDKESNFGAYQHCKQIFFYYTIASRSEH